MGQREDFGCVIPLVWAGVWIWVFTAVGSVALQVFAAVMAVGALGYVAKRFWYGAPMTREDVLRVANKWEEDGRTGRRPLVAVEVKEQARRKKLRELEPGLSEQEFASLDAMIGAHYYGYSYDLTSLMVDHAGFMDSYSVSTDSDMRIRAAFLRHKDKFPKYEEDPPPHQ